MAESVAWLMMAVGDDRQHGGNDGYDDDPATHYSWDNTVPNSSAVKVGDYVVLWDKQTVLGASVIESIDIGVDDKIIKKCPNRLCTASKIKTRSTKTPKYYCSGCRQAFEDAKTRVEEVTTYRSTHDAGWVDLAGCVPGSELRLLCEKPGSQHAMRRIHWSNFRAAVDRAGYGEVLLAVESRAISGHRQATVRVRIGQAAFRRTLFDQLGGVCAFTGPAPHAALEAGHLYSYAKLGEHRSCGGLLLRRDIHRLFDDGDLAVDPATDTIDVGPRLAGFPEYNKLAGRPLQIILTAGHRTWLAQHYAEHRTPGELGLGRPV